MTDNEIIVNWLGVCKAHFKSDAGCDAIQSAWPRCELCGYYIRPRDYERDPAAWDEGLWNEILEKQISLEFVSYLADIAEETIGNDNIYLDYFMISSTPAQKARALAQAIEESKNG